MSGMKNELLAKERKRNPGQPYDLKRIQTRMDQNKTNLINRYGDWRDIGGI
jgi:hypothetical protein